MLLELHNIQVPTCFPRSTMYLIKLFQVLLTIPNSYIITFGPTSTKYKMSLTGLFMDAIGACSKLLQKTNGKFWFKDGKLKGEEDIQFWNQKSVKKWRARRGTDISILLGKGKERRQWNTGESCCVLIHPPAQHHAWKGDDEDHWSLRFSLILRASDPASWMNKRAERSGWAQGGVK